MSLSNDNNLFTNLVIIITYQPRLVEDQLEANCMYLKYNCVTVKKCDKSLEAFLNRSVRLYNHHYNYYQAYHGLVQYFGSLFGILVSKTSHQNDNLHQALLSLHCTVNKGGGNNPVYQSRSGPVIPHRHRPNWKQLFSFQVSICHNILIWCQV